MSAVVARDDLARLADIANSEHAIIRRLVDDAALAVVRGGASHAITAGVALLEARSLLTGDGVIWRRWCADNLSFSLTTMRAYSRIATHRDEVEAWLAAGGSGKQTDALVALRGLPPFVFTPAASTETRQEAVALRKQGLSYAAIGKKLSVSAVTVNRWLDPAFTKRSQARARAKRKRDARALVLLRREEEANAIRSMGGDIAKAYSLVRKLALVLDSAMQNAEDDEQRSHLRRAIEGVHRADNGIVAASKTAPTTGPRRARWLVEPKETP